MCCKCQQGIWWLSIFVFIEMFAVYFVFYLWVLFLICFICILLRISCINPLLDKVQRHFGTRDSSIGPARGEASPRDSEEHQFGSGNYTEFIWECHHLHELSLFHLYCLSSPANIITNPFNQQPQIIYALDYSKFSNLRPCFILNSQTAIIWLTFAFF